ncbi:Fc.00g010520.m01.CDS01 [Cosmosporella sp. VM-42]
MSINWKLYEQDINRWYLDQDKTVKETVQLLKDTHHLVVTERQFKSKFGGLKNLRANEWKAVIPHIRGREAQGLASVVYLSGKRLKLDSTTRAVRRYSKTPQGEVTNGTEIDLGIDTVGRHRIEIRTPVVSSAASALIRHPNTSRTSAGSAEIQQISDDIVLTDSSREIGLSGQVTELDDIEIDFSTRMDVNLSVESVLKLPNLFPSPQLGLGWTIAGEIGPNSFSQFLDLESWSQNGPKRPFLSFWDLPDINQLFLRHFQHTTLIAIAARQGHEHIINYLISAGADINKRCSIECCYGDDNTALFEAVKSNHVHIVKLLLEKGAHFNGDETVGNDNIFRLAWEKDREMYSMLREIVPLMNEPDVFELIDAAEMGNREVSSLLLKHGIVHKEIMEQALYGAIEARKVNAVGTLLRRGVDPNARLAQLPGDSTAESSCDETEFTSPIHLLLRQYEGANTVPDLLYLLVKAGAKVDEETAQELWKGVSSYFSGDSTKGLRTLSVLLQPDGNAAWVRPTLLVCLAGAGHISSCGELLDTGTAINDYGLEGESALQMASRRGHIALVHYLLSRGADVNLAPSDSKNGASALYAALEGGHHKLAYDLIDAGANVMAGIGQADGATILEAMAPQSLKYGVIPSAEEYLHTFKKLLALGAPVNRANGTASRILHNLVKTKQHECLELAVRAGARIEDTLKGLTPLQAAAFLGDMDSLQILIAHGANINTSEDQESHPLGSEIYPTVTFPKEPEQGLSLNYIFHRQKFEADLCCTPLQAASISKHTNPPLIKFLLEHGAKINAPAIAAFGRTALQAATSSEKPNLEVIHLLLLEGADVNAPPAKKGGVTALQGAAIQGNIEIARLLLAYGALINALPAPEAGRTALEGAAEHGRMEMVRFLFSEGALPDPFLGFSRAIELAEKECHLGIVKFLREHDPNNLLITDPFP